MPNKVIPTPETLASLPNQLDPDLIYYATTLYVEDRPTITNYIAFPKEQISVLSIEMRQELAHGLQEEMIRVSVEAETVEFAAKQQTAENEDEFARSA